MFCSDSQETEEPLLNAVVFDGMRPEDAIEILRDTESLTSQCEMQLHAASILGKALTHHKHKNPDLYRNLVSMSIISFETIGATSMALKSVFQNRFGGGTYSTLRRISWTGWKRSGESIVEDV